MATKLYVNPELHNLNEMTAKGLLVLFKPILQVVTMIQINAHINFR